MLHDETERVPVKRRPSVRTGRKATGQAVSAGGRPLQRKGAATRTRLVDAATETFGSLPFDDVKVTDVTRCAGVSSGTFYTYFESKEAIFGEVATIVLAELRTASQATRAEIERDPLCAIERSVRGYFQASASRREALVSIERLASSDHTVREARSGSLATSARRVERLVRHLQALGTCDPSLDPWMTAVSLHTMTVAMGFDRFVRQTPPDDIETVLVPLVRIWAKVLGLDDSHLADRSNS